VAGLLTVPVMTLGMAMHRSGCYGCWNGPWPRPWFCGRAGPSSTRPGGSPASAHRTWTPDRPGAGSAYAYSVTTLWWRSRHVYFEAAAGIVTFVLLGRYLEERAKGKASEAIRRWWSSSRRPPPCWTAWRTAVSVDSLRVGDLLLVRPGDRIPADGLVSGGTSDVDESHGDRGRACR